MLQKNDVIRILRSEQDRLKKEFGVKRIAIFGSFARGDEKETSDVDIFIEIDKPLGLRFFRLTDYLEKKLGRKTDVLTPGGVAGIRIKKVLEDIQRSMIYV